MLIAVRRKTADFDEMCDVKTLKQWARTGQLSADDSIKEQGVWIEAKNSLLLRGIFATAAWDVAEDVLWTPTLRGKSNNQLTNQSRMPKSNPSNSEDSIPNVSAADKKHEDVTASAEMNQAANNIKSEPTIDFEQVQREYQRTKPKRTLDTGGQLENPPIVPPHEVPSSDFQNATPLSEHTSNNESVIQGVLKDEPVRWNPNVDIKDQLGLLVDEVPSKSNFSWFRLFILVVPGAFLLFLLRAFVISESQTVFPDATNPAAETEVAEGTIGNAPVPTNTQSDALYELEASLKAKLRDNAQAVTPEQTLADALRVDLEYVGLSIVRIDARVLKWKGRMLDQPRSASITITIDSQGEIENEFILASLVVAKYAVRYYLEMPRFTITIQDGDLALSKSIETEKAQFLYLQPGSLKDFIRALSENP